jgi:hypothetical protein
MIKNKKIIISAVILICLVFLGIFFLTSRTVSKPVVELSYQDSIPNPVTVYDFMEQLQNEGKINFTEKNYAGMGKLIDGINGIKNNNSQSWIYYVNGKEAQVGVSNYKIKSGDVVSWKYEKSNY